MTEVSYTVPSQMFKHTMLYNSTTAVIKLYKENDFNIWLTHTCWNCPIYEAVTRLRYVFTESNYQVSN